jgi:alpha-ribazole phosphatase
MGVTLVRHTKPDVAPGVCYGRTDLDVAASFPREAALVAAALPRFATIVTSPLKRCVTLADYLGQRAGLAPIKDPRLREMDFGAWEGLAWSDIPRTELDDWAADFLHARPHGGETVAMLRSRTLEAVCEWMDGRGDTLIVTHSGVIRSALSTGDGADDFAANINFGGFHSLSFLKGATP